MYKTNNYLSIGILGGIGPEASADLYSRIIKLYQKNFYTRYSSDFPEIIIHSVPLPDIVELPYNRDEVALMLQESCQKLERFGANFIAMPCNTGHIFLEEMRASVRIPILSIMNETAKYLPEESQPVLILATDMTIKSKLFQTIFDGKQIAWKIPESIDQQKMSDIILSVNAGNNGVAQEQELVRMIDKSGAKSVLLACTELPMAISQQATQVPLLDTIEILAESCFTLSSSADLENVARQS